MNKRPRGTALLEEPEKLQIIDSLKKQHSALETAQTRMSVTHYTQRARNQYADFIHQTQGLEDSMKVLQRKKFVMNQ